MGRSFDVPRVAPYLAGMRITAISLLAFVALAAGAGAGRASPAGGFAAPPGRGVEPVTPPGLEAPAPGAGPLAPDGDQQDSVLTIPGLPRIPVPPGPRAFGPDGPLTAGSQPNLVPAPTPAPEAGVPPPPPVPDRKDVLDGLFSRLAKATDPDEAQGIAALIQHVWMHSGSDTADLLMMRALAAQAGDHRDVALALLDKVIALEPGWAEAWNKRATLRFLGDDDSGSMEDIGHVLALEPRHYGAISGMGFILKRHGLDKQALTALRRALELFPADADLRKAVDALTPEVEGREL